MFNHSTCSVFFWSCKILFGLAKFMTAPDQMSGNDWKEFMNTVFSQCYYHILTCIFKVFDHDKVHILYFQTLAFLMKHNFKNYEHMKK